MAGKHTGWAGGRPWARRGGRWCGVPLGAAVAAISTPAGQRPPALQPYWLAIRVPSITLAAGAFVVAAMFAVVYRLADRHGKRVPQGLPTRAGAIFRFLPAPKMI